MKRKYKGIVKKTSSPMETVIGYYKSFTAFLQNIAAIVQRQKTIKGIVSMQSAKATEHGLEKKMKTTDATEKYLLLLLFARV
jgi:hypothetical protein